MSDDKKIYKKGRTIVLHCCTHDMGSDVSEEVVLEADCTVDDLNEMAKDFMENEKQPEWWFKVKGDDD